MKRYEIRDAVIAVGLPLVTAMGLLAVNHHVHLPGEHTSKPVPVAEPASSHNDAGDVSLNLPSNLDELLSPDYTTDPNETLDRVSVGILAFGPPALWIGAACLPRRRENGASPQLAELQSASVPNELEKV